MKALVLHKTGDFRFEDIEKPTPQENEVLLKVKAAGICGSDIDRVLHGGVYSFPLIPGHEFAGQIEQVGKGVSADLVGKKAAVFPLIPCRKCASCEIGQYAQCGDYDYIGSRRNGAFAEYVVVPKWNLVLAPNDNITYEELAFCEPAGIAMHAVRLANIDIADTVAIFGAGPIGLLLAMIAKNTRGCKVLIVDVDQKKVDFAKSIGFDECINSRDTDAIEWISEKTNGVMADVCFEGAGVSSSVQSCLLATRKFGKVIGVGIPHKEITVSMQAYQTLLRRQLSLIGTWNSVYSSLPKNEWHMVANLIAEHTLDVAPLISHRVSLSDGIAPIKMMAERKEFFNKIMYIP